VSELLNSLQSVLKQEVELHQRLLEKLLLEKESYGQVSGKELLRIQAEKNQMVQGIVQAERQRIWIVEQLAKCWGVAAVDLRLKQIIARTERDRSVLQNCYEELNSLLDKIHHQAQQNAQLAASRLKSVNLMLASVKPEQEKIYSGSGKLQNPSSTFKRSSI